MATLTLRPNAAGDATQLGQYPNSTYNWDKVDEATSDSDTTYVTHATANSWLRDLYGLPDHTTESGTINSVKVYILHKRVDFGTDTLARGRTIIKTVATEYRGADHNPGTSYALTSTTYATNPNTGSAWTWAQIDALQSGYDGYYHSTDKNNESVPRCTQVYVEVDYTPIVAPTVTTQAATDVLTTSCTGNGNITATGGENCTRRGFCYMVGTSGDPTTANSVAYDDGSFGTGAYTKGITGLTPSTGYRVRAYANNSAGTGYGDTVQVTTTAALTQKTLTEAISAIDTIIKRGRQARAESLTLVATLGASRIFKAMTDVASILDTKVNEWKTILVDPLSIVDSVVKFRAVEKAVSDTIVAIDNSVKSVSKFFSSIITLVESISVVKISAAIQRSFSEAVSIVDTEIKSATKAVLDVIALVESTSTVRTLVRLYSEVVTLLDTSANSFKAIIADTVVLVDLLAKSTTKITLEVVTLIESVIKRSVRLYSEVITIIDTPVRRFSATFADTITLVESLTKSTIKVMSDTIILVDTTLKSIIRTFGDIISILDTQVNKFALAITSSITLVESTLKSAYKATVDSVSITDIMLSLSEYWRTLVESIVLAESVVKQAYRSATDSLLTIDTVTKYIGRVVSSTITILDSKIYSTRLYIEDSLDVVDSALRYIWITRVESFAVAASIGSHIRKAISDAITAVASAITSFLSPLELVIHLETASYFDIAVVTESCLDMALSVEGGGVGSE